MESFVSIYSVTYVQILKYLIFMNIHK